MTDLIDLSEANLLPDQLDRNSIINQFLCVACQNIAIYPVKCTTCESVYCKTCLPAEVLKGENPFKCIKDCENSSLRKLGRIERLVLGSLTFQCQHSEEGCEAEIAYEDMKKHLEKNCTKKIQFIEEPELKLIAAPVPAVVQQKPKPQPQPVQNDEEEVDMGGLFGDDDY